MKINKKEKGITLIALIITIIVMLILVAVSIRIVITSGLFDSAKVASRKTDSAYKEESTIGNLVNINGKTYNSVEEYVKQEGTVGGGEEEIKDKKSYLKIGDYVDYSPSADMLEKYTKATKATSGYNQEYPQDTTLKWRIMSINDDGTVELISDKPTSTVFKLSGVNGFNNGVFFLNDICKSQYSNTTLGIEARSIKLEDLEKQYNDTATNLKNSGKYGKPKTYTGTLAATPDIYKHLDGSPENGSVSYYTDPTTAGYSASSSFTVTNTMYYVASNGNDTTEYYKDANFSNTVLTNDGSIEGFWIATRCCDTGDVKEGVEGLVFGISSTYKVFLRAEWLFWQGEDDEGTNKGIRPVVTLGNNIQISETGGTAAEPRTLTAI